MYLRELSLDDFKSFAETNIIEIQEMLTYNSGPAIGQFLEKRNLRNKPFKELSKRFEQHPEDIDNQRMELAELLYMDRLLDVYPLGIFSYVSDTYNLWAVLTDVIRPDSGDPCDIICGLNTNEGKQMAVNAMMEAIQIAKKDGIDVSKYNTSNLYKEQENKGVIELLWDVFGGTVNSKGYKVLDSHIGCIYGDAITLERAEEICKRLESKGFASSNIVFGIGSYTYNMNTRDTFGFALKTTYGVVNGKELMLYKDPITDDGTKKSQKGMVSVFRDEYFDEVMYRDEYTKKDKEQAIEMRKAHPTDEHYEMLQTVFLNGELVKESNLQQIRDRLKQELVFDGRLQYASR